MNNIDGYYHQVVSCAALTKLVINFQGNGWHLIPMSLFPGLIAGHPLVHWGHHGVKAEDLRATLETNTGPDTISLNWDGHCAFVVLFADGYYTDLTVYPRHHT